MLGEAASKISADAKARYADIPWREIIGLRHRLIHGYVDVRLDVVWRVATEHLGPLIANLMGIVPGSSADSR